MGLVSVRIELKWMLLFSVGWALLSFALSSKPASIGSCWGWMPHLPCHIKAPPHPPAIHPDFSGCFCLVSPKKAPHMFFALTDWAKSSALLLHCVLKVASSIAAGYPVPLFSPEIKVCQRAERKDSGLYIQESTLGTLREILVLQGPCLSCCGWVFFQQRIKDC